MKKVIRRRVSFEGTLIAHKSPSDAINSVVQHHFDGMSDHTIDDVKFNEASLCIVCGKFALMIGLDPATGDVSCRREPLKSIDGAQLRSVRDSVSGDAEIFEFVSTGVDGVTSTWIWNPLYELQPLVGARFHSITNSCGVLYLYYSKARTQVLLIMPRINLDANTRSLNWNATD